MRLFKIKTDDLKSVVIHAQEPKDFFANLDVHHNEQSILCAIILFKSGLTKPLTKILQVEGMAPRAYETYPTVYSDIAILDNEDSVLVELPESYDKTENQLAPSVNHEVILEIDAHDLLQKIWGGGWGPFCHVAEIKPKGIPLPTDLSSDSTIHPTSTYRPTHVFVNSQVPSHLKGNFNANKYGVKIETVGDTHLISARCKSTEHLPEQITSLPQISLQAYTWINQDNYDISIGVEPPPMPKTIATELKKVGLVLPTHKTALQLNHFKPS